MKTQTTNKRKSFIIYKDSLSVLKKLTVEQKANLFDAIADYQIDSKFPIDSLTSIIFEPFLNQFIRDDENYLNTCEARREAGAKGGKQKVANASKSKQKVANLADSDSKSDNDNESKNESKSVSKKIFIAPTLQEIEVYCQERKNSVNPKSFHDYYSAGSWKDAKGNQVRNWKQKLLTWEGRGEANTKEGAQSNTNEALTLFINNLIGNTLIKSITVSSSNKAVLQFTNKPCFDLFVKMEDELKNQAKKKISDQLGTNGFEPKY